MCTEHSFCHKHLDDKSYFGKSPLYVFKGDFVSSVIRILYLYSVYVVYCAYYILHETKRERQLAQGLRTWKAQLSTQLSGESIFPPFTPNLEVKYLGGQI